MKFVPDVRNCTFFASSITSFLVLRNSASEAQVVFLEMVEIIPFTISSSYNGEFEIDSFKDGTTSGDQVPAHLITFGSLSVTLFN